MLAAEDLKEMLGQVLGATGVFHLRVPEVNENRQAGQMLQNTDNKESESSGGFHSKKTLQKGCFP